MLVLRGRHLGSLLTAWAAVLCVAGALYWFQTVLPALADMFTPVYVVLGVVLLVVTWKWLRWRARQRDRRQGERRHAERRDAPQPDAGESVGRQSP